jgi:hypothetical protein
LLCVILITCSSCSEFALIASAGSVAASQNAYSKAYGTLDFGVVISTKKDIKTHTYERIRKKINERD